MSNAVVRLCDDMVESSSKSTKPHGRVLSLQVQDGPRAVSMIFSMTWVEIWTCWDGCTIKPYRNICYTIQQFNDVTSARVGSKPRYQVSSTFPY